ncbi:MAG: hypothetical protein WBD83_25190, partial [Xanthobacteraceae bacterium]
AVDMKTRERRSEPVSFFGQCSRGHRARLVCYENGKLSHQESYVRILLAGHINAYQVTCPTCGEEYDIGFGRGTRE